MRARACCGLLLLMTAAESTAAESTVAETTTPEAQDAIPPFSAHYVAEWKGITVGTSDLQLRSDAEPQHYLYKWTITARGIFRLVYPDDLTQQSWFEVLADHVRPEKYRAEEGASSVSLDFDWDGGRARGRSENKPVQFPLKSGSQDLMSIQIEVMLDLKNGDLPNLFHIIDKDQLKDFIYTREGMAKLRTAIGPLDTVIVSSRRAGNDRILRMWFASSLGFVPVQAERSRDGKVEFAMRIKTLKR
jgi:Protein of unknown function (DUF3108)